MKNLEDLPGIAPIVQHFDGLPEQPKQNIAESIGTPDVFPDLASAESESERFMARSEHPYELFYSGLTSSYDSSMSFDAIKELDEVFRNPLRTHADLIDGDRKGRLGFLQAAWWHYLAFGGEYGGARADEFSRQHSFSYWRYTPGDNFYMVEDSGVKGRYFVGKLNGEPGLAVVEDGKVIEHISWNGERNYPQVDADKLIEFYETTRRATLFDGGNCPILELVDPGGNDPIVFLQYHPTNDSSHNTEFEIKKQSDTFFVRGATPVDGIEIQLYMREMSDRRKPTKPYGLGLVSINEATNEYFDTQAEIKIMPRVRNDDTGSRRRILNATIDHGTRTSVFKPRVTVGIPEQSYEALYEAARADGTVEAYIVSNGVAALIQYYCYKEQKVISL